MIYFQDMSHGSDAYEVARSFDVLTDPRTYKPFDHANLMRMVGCIDPRDEKGDEELKVIVQTAGGAAGKGLDSAFALTASDGELHTLEDGLKLDRRLQRSTIAGAHDDVCRFIHGIGQVTAEIINPSDRMTYVLGSLIARYDHDRDEFFMFHRRIQDAAKHSLDSLGEISPEEILDTVDKLYPFHQNVVGMSGENRAGFYILNHHPYAGLDRARVHRGDSPLVVHAYHDSVRATNDSLLGTVGMSNDMKGLRLAALFSRIAATQTVLCRDDPDMIYLHAVPTSRGIQIEQEVSPWS